MKDKQRVDFYLASSEGYGLAEPRGCYKMAQLRSQSRDDLLLVRIVPGLDISGLDVNSFLVDKVILSTKFHGETLSPIKKWPVHVYVDLLLDLELKVGTTDIDDKNRKLIAWAQIYKTYEDALEKRI